MLCQISSVPEKYYHIFSIAQDYPSNSQVASMNVLYSIKKCLETKELLCLNENSKSQ